MCEQTTATEQALQQVVLNPLFFILLMYSCLCSEAAIWHGSGIHHVDPAMLYFSPITRALRTRSIYQDQSLCTTEQVSASHACTC